MQDEKKEVKGLDVDERKYDEPDNVKVGNGDVQEAGVTVEDTEDSDSAVDRGQWGSPIEFVLSCLGYAVGLGNVWRFPFLVYENGGGAFLIPYVLMLVFVGLPMFFIELAVGQYVGGGPMTVWPISPIFLGVGAGMMIINFIQTIYYNMLMAWSLYYLFASWQSVLPWSTCTHDYNTPYCYTKAEAEGCENSNGTWFNMTCFNETEVSAMNNYTFCSEAAAADRNCTPYNWLTEARTHKRAASDEYYSYSVLDMSGGIEETGYMKWDLVLVLLAAWLICWLGLIKGIKSSGKVVYFTATFPYVILIILCVRGALLPGAIEGVKFYIIPKFEKLGTAKVWADAAGQVFFSLSVGMGGLMTFASYNPFHNNIYRDTLVVVILDAFTSVFAGFTIFSILGYLAYVLDTTVDNVVTSGSGLAFIAYPEVVTYLQPPQLWATLFFLMLITLGIDTQFASIETVMTAIVDQFPLLRTKKIFVSAIICAVMFLLGLTMCTQAGVYWLELMSYYSSGWSLILIALVECIVFCWIYGASRLMKDIKFMVGFKLYPHWWVCWVIITPALLAAILIFNMIDFSALTYGDYVYPEWSQILGWLMAVVSVAFIPVFAVYVFWKSYKQPEYDGLTFFRRLIKLTQPTADWQPTDKKARRELAAAAAAGAAGSSSSSDDDRSSVTGNGYPPKSPVYFTAIDDVKLTNVSGGFTNFSFEVDSTQF